jgi:hypothetical protein
LAEGKRILNCFCYPGGFTLAALRATGADPAALRTALLAQSPTC